MIETAKHDFFAAMPHAIDPHAIDPHDANLVGNFVNHTV